MQIQNLSAGVDVPDDIHVVIEIQAYGPGLKLELEKASGALMLDRFLATPMHYPCNYGFIPHTLSLDGDPLDALVVTPIPVPAGMVVRCREPGRWMTPSGWFDLEAARKAVLEAVPRFEGSDKRPPF